jgi:PST family polysaccharide transporter
MTATKIVAAVLGPPGLAMLATLQQTRNAAVSAATLNGGTALVQGISARAGDRRRDFVRTLALLFGAATAAVAAALAAAPAWVAQLVGLSAGNVSLMRWLALPVALSSAFVFLNSLLVALGEIRKVAALQLVSPLVLALAAFPVARGAAAGYEGLLILLVAMPAAAGTAGAWALLGAHRATLRVWLEGGGRWWHGGAARSFFAVSGAMLATGLLGSTALLAVRSRILSAEGLASAGKFDAAWAISMNHVTLVLASLQVYFLPALARSRDGAERSAHVSHGLLLAALITGPAIIAVAALKPWILAALYSAEFTGASTFLRWTLLGDYLKTASWILSAPLLAAADMRAFVAADVVAYGVFLGGAAGLSRWYSAAEGAAMAFVLMYAVHLAVCGACSWIRHGARPDARTVVVWLAGFAAVCAASAVFWGVS